MLYRVCRVGLLCSLPLMLSHFWTIHHKIIVSVAVAETEL